MRSPVLSTLAALVPILLLASWSPSSLHAQEADTGSIVGTVRATGNEVAAGERGAAARRERPVSVAGLAVELVEPGLRTVTDAEGRFAFRGLAPGSYTVRLRVPGRATWTERAAVEAGRTARVELRVPSAAIALPDIDVMLSRVRLVGRGVSEVPGAAHVLTPREIEERGLLFDDVNKLLHQVPGVNVQEEEGYGLRPNIGIRGAGSERSSKITLMEDGVLIAPAPYAAPAAYYFPVAGRMEAVEVRMGSSQIKYGPRTTGGALNLVSAPIPDRLVAKAELQGGEDATGKLQATLGDSYRRFGWLAQTYQLRTDGFKRLDGGGATGFEVQDYLVKMRLNSDPNVRIYQSLELKLGYTDERSDETYVGLTEVDFRLDPFRRYAGSAEDVMKAEHRQAQLRHFARLSSTVDFTTTLYYNDFARNWYKLDSVLGTGIAAVLGRPSEHADALAVLRGEESEADALVLRANNRDYYSRGAETVMGLRFDAGVSHELEAGIRFHQDQEDRFQHEDGYRMSGGRPLLTSSGAPGSQSNRVSDADAWAAFVQDRIDVGPWTFVPGLRFERIRFTRTDYDSDDPARAAPSGIRDNGLDVWIPGVGVARRLSPAVSLFGGVHRGFSPPGPGADRETRPEESWNYELGTRLDAGAVRAQAVAFFNDYRNMLGKATLATGESGTGDLFNGGAVDVAGLELSAGWDPLADGSADGGPAAEAGSGRRLSLPIQLAYTFTHARFRSSFESDFDPWGTVTSGDRLPYMPDHQLFASLALRHPHWRVGVSATVVDEMRTVAGNGPIAAGEGTDAFAVLDLSGEYALSTWGSLFAAVQNVTDETYVVSRRPAGARPGLPRTFSAGLKLSR